MVPCFGPLNWGNPYPKPLNPKPLYTRKNPRVHTSEPFEKVRDHTKGPCNFPEILRGLFGVWGLGMFRVGIVPLKTNRDENVSLLLSRSLALSLSLSLSHSLSHSLSPVRHHHRNLQAAMYQQCSKVTLNPQTPRSLAPGNPKAWGGGLQASELEGAKRLMGSQCGAWEFEWLLWHLPRNPPRRKSFVGGHT